MDGVVGAFATKEQLSAHDTIHVVELGRSAA